MRKPGLLAVCLARLDWSPERLANEINRKCGPGTISAKAPYGWLKGSSPRGGLSHAVAAILSDRIGERVSAGQLWPGKHHPPAAVVAADEGMLVRWTPEGTRECLTTLGRQLAHLELRTLRALSGPELLARAIDWRVAEQRPPEAWAGSEEVGEDMVAALEARVVHLRHMDDTRAGRMVLDWTVHELKWAVELVQRGTYGAAVSARLNLVISELAQLAGWLALDAGDHARAQQLWIVGLHAAHSAGDWPLGANIVSCLSYQATWLGQGRQALELVRIARSAVQQHPAGSMHALLASREARAHAILGNVNACELAIAEARSYAEADRAQDPPWSYWITPAVLTADAGRALLDVGRLIPAEQALEQGLELFGSCQPRNRMLHLASLAEARLARGEVDGAAEAAEQATGLAAVMQTSRGRQRLRLLHRALAGRPAAVAQEASERIASVLHEPEPAVLTELS